MRPTPPEALTSALHAVVPDASLSAQNVPNLPLSLWLLTHGKQNRKLSPEAIRAALETPPFWCVAWPSGRVLGEWIVNNRFDVRGQRVADFGCGSGIVALACAQAGAADVIAADLDTVALAATDANALLNDLRIQKQAEFFTDECHYDTIFAADIFYDAANLPLLDRLKAKTNRLIVADCRAHDLARAGLEKIDEAESSTWPDVDPSDQFRRVSVYEWRSNSSKAARGAKIVTSSALPRTSKSSSLVIKRRV